jgi:hypothetical protein
VVRDHERVVVHPAAPPALHRAIIAACCARTVRRTIRRERSASERARPPATSAWRGGCIGCFDAAPGCVARGAPSDEATWFAGYAWTCVACANCGEHLGWVYERAGAGAARFFGLILIRLRE